MLDGLTHDLTTLDMLGNETKRVTLDQLDRISERVKVLNTNGQVDFCNSVDDPSNLPKTAWWTHWPEDLKQPLRTAFERALDGQITMYAARTPEEDVALDFRITPVFSDDGDVTAVLAIARDVTDEA